MRNLAAASFGWILDNPVVNKELRGRMRGPRAYWMMLGYLVILSIAMLLTYYAWHQQQGYGAAGFQVGRTFFRTLFYVQATLVSLITPALTSGAISIEREQRTYEMVRCTNLRPSAIVAGKLFSAISFITLLLVCSLPLVSVCFLVGGVSPQEVLGSYGLLVCDGLLFGAIGIAWSTCAANTAAATALSYVSVFGYFLLTITTAATAQAQNGVALPFTALNPVGAATGATAIEHYYSFSIPAWVTAILVNGLLTILLCAIAVNRMDDYPWRRAGVVRLSTFAWSATVLFFLDGAWVSHAFPTYVASAGALSIMSMGLIVLCCILPSLTTGEPVSETELGIPLFPPVVNPVTAFKEATTRSSTLTCFLFTAMVTAITLVSMQNGVNSAVTSGSNVDLHTYETAAAALYWGLTVAMLGIGGVLSSVLRNRWGSMTLVLIIVALAFLVPALTFSSVSHSPGRNWLYFSAPWSMAELGDSGSGFGDVWLFFSGTAPPWMVTSVLYGLIGAVSFIVTMSLRRRLVKGVPPPTAQT